MATTSTSTLKVFYRYNGTNSGDAGNYALTTTTPMQLATTTFSGLFLSKTASSTLQIGAVLSSGGAGDRLNRIAAIVTYYTPPAAPTSLTASTTATSTISLAWVDNSSTENGFTVERGTDGIKFSKVGTVGIDVTTFNDNGLTSGTYYYRVRAYNNGGFSGYSNIASSTIP